MRIKGALCKIDDFVMLNTERHVITIQKMDTSVFFDFILLPEMLTLR